MDTTQIEGSEEMTKIKDDDIDFEAMRLVNEMAAISNGVQNSTVILAAVHHLASILSSAVTLAGIRKDAVLAHAVGLLSVALDEHIKANSSPAISKSAVTSKELH